MAAILLCLLVLGLSSALTYGHIAAYLVELFPARVRYTSLSMPYHVATGYIGGCRPFVSQLIVVKTGNPFAGLWYPVFFHSLAFFVTLLFLPEHRGVNSTEGGAMTWSIR